MEERTLVRNVADQSTIPAIPPRSEVQVSLTPSPGRLVSWTKRARPSCLTAFADPTEPAQAQPGASVSIEPAREAKVGSTTVRLAVAPKGTAHRRGLVLR